VFDAETPTQARKLVRDAERPIQLLMVDLNHDGLEFAREVHAGSPALRLLGIGNQDMPPPVDWISPTHQAGLSKPFALSEISRSVRALLDA
jgi:hypothetical protein